MDQKTSLTSDATRSGTRAIPGPSFWREPNQLWSRDITKIRGPAKWTYYYLYVLLDVFSRYVVGWMVAHRESSSLAKKLIEETCVRQATPLASRPPTEVWIPQTFGGKSARPDLLHVRICGGWVSDGPAPD